MTTYKFEVNVYSIICDYNETDLKNKPQISTALKGR